MTSICLHGIKRSVQRPHTTTTNLILLGHCSPEHLQKRVPVRTKDTDLNTLMDLVDIRSNRDGVVPGKMGSVLKSHGGTVDSVSKPRCNDPSRISVGPKSVQTRRVPDEESGDGKESSTSCTGFGSTQT